MSRYGTLYSISPPDVQNNGRQGRNNAPKVLQNSNKLNFCIYICLCKLFLLSYIFHKSFT